MPVHSHIMWKNIQVKLNIKIQKAKEVLYFMPVFNIINCKK